jgi:signal transduction histidine kinase
MIFSYVCEVIPVLREKTIIKSRKKSVIKISLSEKLILYFLTLGLGAIAVITVFSFYSTKKALLNRTFDQLTSLRIVKKHQVELFFADRLKDITLLSESEDSRKIIGDLYIYSKETSLSNDEQGKKQLLVGFAGYLKKYTSLNSYFNSICVFNLNKPALKGNFSDPENVEIGPADSAEYITLYSQPLRGGVLLKDEIIDRKTREPKMFLVSSIEIPHLKGVYGKLILELSVDAINTIMLNNNPESGLGLTGETYLVGNDYLMRSTSRFQPASILRTKVETESAVDAFSDKEGFIISNDYRNIPVLSSYSKIQVPGLNWAILAEIDLKEAMVPIYKMRNSILFLSIMIAVVFFMFVFIIAKRITRPVIELKNAAIRVGQGQYDIHLPIQTGDEIGALTDSFNSMAGQIKEKTLELENERKGRLRSVFDGEEIERQRLSRELHDGIGQYLIALKLRMESLSYSDHPGKKENIREVIDMFDTTIDEIRRISNNLMPSVLDAFGITMAIRNLCNETGENAGTPIDFECSGDLEEMPAKITTYIFRIAQEALNNIVKHSYATSVRLRLSREDDSVMLTVIDNGIGFDPVRASESGGNGLHNMRERVDLLHGSFKIDSVINHGTTLTVMVPLN